MALNERAGFVIKDLDDYHVVIKADEEWRVRQELEAEVRVGHFEEREDANADAAPSWKRTRIVWSPEDT